MQCSCTKCKDWFVVKDTERNCYTHRLYLRYHHSFDIIVVEIIIVFIISVIIIIIVTIIIVIIVINIVIVIIIIIIIIIIVITIIICIIWLLSSWSSPSLSSLSQKTDNTRALCEAPYTVERLFFFFALGKEENHHTHFSQIAPPIQT